MSAASLDSVAFGIFDEIGDSSVDCQSYVEFVIEVVGTLGRASAQTSRGMKSHSISTDEPITTGDFRPPFMRHFSDMPMDAANVRQHGKTARERRGQSDAFGPLRT